MLRRATRPHAVGPDERGGVVATVIDTVDGPVPGDEVVEAGEVSGLEVSVSWVFPVTSGTHSYTLDAGQVDFAGGPLSFYNPLLVAQFVPYGGTGSPTSLGTSSIETSAGAEGTAE